jgi:hypothetical protein
LPGVLLGEIEARWPSWEDAERALEPLIERKVVAQPGHVRLVAPIAGGGGVSEDVQLEVLERALSPEGDTNPELDRRRRQHLLRYFTSHWTGRDRFGLASDQQLGDLHQRPSTHLNVLFRDDELRSRARKLVHDAFGLYFVLDPTAPGQLRMKLSPAAPPSPKVERGLDDEAIAFHDETMPLQEQSDGVQSYVGIVTALMSVNLRLVMIDEPDAFLHPPLARRLGATIAEVARGRDAMVVTATHSAAFLRGCVESAADTTIVRLTYERTTDEATARVLTATEVRPLLREPLLRSSRALEGLFHRAVVVGESDADRAFYDEINRRLVEVGRGVTDAQFVNAQNWMTEARIVAPLRRLGVPAAAILDIDTLWEPRHQWRPLYRAVDISESGPEWTRLENERQACTEDASRRAACKQRGPAALPMSHGRTMRRLIDSLAEYGVFIVPKGELESWLSRLGIARRDKHRWIVDMLNALGSDPRRPSYVHPGRGDVWAFLDRIEEWVRDPARKGMP